MSKLIRFFDAVELTDDDYLQLRDLQSSDEVWALIIHLTDAIECLKRERSLLVSENVRLVGCKSWDDVPR